MNPLISIIVPVYNTERNLHRCIESIQNQTFVDWELLLIDDGSVDHSGELCDQYAAKDQRIKVFHKKNGGVSSARNVGLDNAKGEWITFCDSDDEILNNTFALYDRIIKEHNEIDLISCGYIIYYKSGAFKNISCEKDIISKDKKSNLLNCEENSYYGFLWDKCFRASIAKKYRFDETISYCEDHLYTYQYLLQCRCAYFSPDIVYKYYVNDIEAKGKGHSKRLLDYKMIINVAKLERTIKYKFYRGDKNLESKIESAFTYKIMDAMYYAIINQNFMDAYQIYKKYYSGERLFLLSYIIKNYFSPYLRKIKNYNLLKLSFSNR